MNVKYDLTETGGLPLDEDILNDLQNGIFSAEQITNVLGRWVILSGCLASGPSFGNGWVAIDGEVLPFVGGVATAKVIVRQTIQNLTYFDDVVWPSQITRYATFGDDGVQNNPWDNFQRDSGSGLLARLADAETAIGDIGAELTVKQGEIDMLNSEMGAAQGNIDSLAGRMGAAEGNIGSLEGTVSAQGETIEEQGEAIADLQGNVLRRLASGTEVLGDADPNHTGTGFGATHTIEIGKTLANTNYMVLFSVYGLSGNTMNDLYHHVVYKNKSTTTFDLYFREVADTVQNVNVDWVIISL